MEAVLRDEESDIEISRPSGRPTAFGWSLSGARIAVAFEEMSEDRKSSTRLPLTPCRQREARKGESDERHASRSAKMERGSPRPAQGYPPGIGTLPDSAGLAGKRGLRRTDQERGVFSCSGIGARAEEVPAGGRADLGGRVQAHRHRSGHSEPSRERTASKPYCRYPLALCPSRRQKPGTDTC